MQLTAKMELLSYKYVETISTSIGVKTSATQLDDDSVDITIEKSAGRRPKIDAQLKSTRLDFEILPANAFPFDLKVKNFNDLIPETCSPRILIVYLLPKDDSEWVKHSLKELSMRGCAYWVSLQGREASSNVSTVRVNVPFENVLSPDNLDALLAKVNNGVEL
jgi:Domain of unknown function (DUF4365)